MRCHFESDVEHIKANKLREQFCVDVGRAAAKVLTRFDPDVREFIKLFLQDELSLFDPYTDEHIQKDLKRLDELRRSIL